MGGSQNVRFLEMKLTPSNNADFHPYNDGRFVFCVMLGVKMQKLGRYPGWDPCDNRSNGFIGVRSEKDVTAN